MEADPLKPVKLELRASENAIRKMESASSVAEFEEEWRDFLGGLEKVWNKTERCCEVVRSQFQPWQGRYTRLRRKDMLVRYLKQARDADNHSIQEVMEYTPPNRQIIIGGDTNGRPTRFYGLVVAGDEVYYEGTTPIHIKTTAERVVAVRVKVNGEWHNPPTSHLGKPVPDVHPLTIAKLGLEFYQNFVMEVEAKFFPK